MGSPLISAEEIMSQNAILWIYILLLLVGGLIGFLKAGSRVSLITSAVCGSLVVVTTIPRLFDYSLRTALADIIFPVLLVVISLRLAKTKKVNPSRLQDG